MAKQRQSQRKRYAPTTFLVIKGKSARSASSPTTLAASSKPRKHARYTTVPELATRIVDGETRYTLSSDGCVYFSDLLVRAASRIVRCTAAETTARRRDAAAAQALLDRRDAAAAQALLDARSSSSITTVDSNSSRAWPRGTDSALYAAVSARGGGDACTDWAGVSAAVLRDAAAAQALLDARSSSSTTTVGSNRSRAWPRGTDSALYAAVSARGGGDACTDWAGVSAAVLRQLPKAATTKADVERRKACGVAACAKRWRTVFAPLESSRDLVRGLDGFARDNPELDRSVAAELQRAVMAEEQAQTLRAAEDERGTSAAEQRAAAPAPAAPPPPPPRAVASAASVSAVVAALLPSTLREPSTPSISALS